MMSKKKNSKKISIGVFLLSVSYFSPEILAFCPAALENLCVSPSVQALVDLQGEMEHVEEPAQRRDRFEKQERIINRMFGISLIRHAATYIAERNARFEHANAAKEIARLAVARSIEVFRTHPPSHPSGNGFDIMALLALQHRLGDPALAGSSLDRFVDHVEGAVSGYAGGLILGEAGRLLAEWNEAGRAKLMFERTRRFSRAQPLRDGEVDFPRFMILIHVVQRAAEAGLFKLARATLSEAGDLRAREHAVDVDLGEIIAKMASFVEKMEREAGN
jgi:hypothetical protein